MSLTEKVLPCKMSEDEIHTAGLELARKSIEADVLAEELARHKERYKVLLARLASERARLCREISTGVAHRAVKVLEELDPVAGVVRLIRLDTRQILETRPATDEDRQEPLITDDEWTDA